MSIRFLTCLLLLFLVSTTAAVSQELYDVVILGGRVIDPETQRDEIANVGILADRIQAITTDDIRGRRTIDASGQIVAPGFIDILASMRLDKSAHEFKIGDGVTTVLGMHGGPLDVEGYRGSHAAVGPLVNYAATVGHAALREAVGATDRYAPATPEQIEAMRPLADKRFATVPWALVLASTTHPVPRTRRSLHFLRSPPPKVCPVTCTRDTKVMSSR